MKIMPCRKVAELTCDFVDDSLSPRKQRRIETHLLACDSCRAAVERFRDVRDLFRLSAAQRSARPVTRIASAPDVILAAMPARQPKTSSLPWLLSLTFHALILALAAVVTFSYSSSGDGNELGLSYGRGLSTPQGHGAGNSLMPVRYPHAQRGDEFLNSAAIERSVRSALAYLARQQRHDGSWDARQGSSAVHDTAVAVLACTQAGRNYYSAFTSDDLKRGVAWLVQHRADANNATDTALVALALSESAQASDDASVRAAAQECVRRLAPLDSRDATARGWTILALKSAADAGLETSRIEFAKPSAASQLNSAADLLQRRLLADSTTAAPSIALHAPDWSSTSDERSPDFQTLDSWYFGTLGLRQSDGINRKSWNAALTRTLIPHQREDNFAAGTWDAASGWDVDPIHCAAVGALCLAAAAEAK